MVITSSFIFLAVFYQNASFVGLIRMYTFIRLELFFVNIQVWSEKAENKIANGSPESQAQVTVDVNRNSTKTPNNELAGKSAYILLKYL